MREALRHVHKKIKLPVMAAAAAAAGIFILLELKNEHPEYFRRRTEMEKTHPVCVLGTADRSGFISKEKAGVRNIYINWKTSFPENAVKAIRASGAVPMITWEPYLGDIRRDRLLAAIASGEYDAYMTRFAMRADGGPLLIRFGHEPNSDWYGWSGVTSGPAAYIRAFRRVRRVFASSGNANARFIFSVNAEDVPSGAWNRFENYYPGDAYADMIGIDAYNWGQGEKPWQKWQEPDKLFMDAYERTIKAFPAKPVFITETASASYGGDKNLWIDKLLGSMERRFPAVKAVVWFDMDKERDWALSQDASRSGFFGTCGKGRFDCSGKGLDWMFQREASAGRR